jgi:hypothetical protein
MAEENETMQQNVQELPAENAVEKKIYANRQEILDRLAEIVNQTTDEVRDEINYLKLVYYKLRQQEVDAEMKKLLEDDADVAGF